MSRAPAVAATVLLLAGGPARAAPVDLLLARLDGAAAGVRTLAGEFSQKSRVRLFRQELASTGRLLFERPRRIRWQYVAPDPSVLIVDGDRATLRSEGNPPQTFDLAADPGLRAVFDQIALWLLPGGLSTARTDFDLAAGGSESEPSLVLAPRAGTAAARAFARIELRFDRRLLLRRILLREVGGDEKEITFTRMEKNVALPRDAFSP